jgi:hypothetical protein
MSTTLAVQLAFVPGALNKIILCYGNFTGSIGKNEYFFRDRIWHA